MNSQRRCCVVFGGGGFLGSHLCRRLRAAGLVVRAFGHRGPFSDALSGIDVRYGELSDRETVAEALDGAEIAFHLIHSTVPQSANSDIFGDVRDNLLPSLSLLDLAREAGLKRIIFLSSGGTVYGRPVQVPTEETAPTDPITAYGISKLAIEKYLALHRLHFGLDYRILRVSNPFGPFQVASKRQGLIAEVISRATRGEPIEIWGDGTVVRDFIFVDDVIDAIEMAAHDVGDEALFNIGSGTGRSVRDVLAAIEGVLGRKLEIVWKDKRTVDVPVSVLSIERAREKLGWAPKTSFEDGIAQTIAWWEESAPSTKHTVLQTSS